MARQASNSGRTGRRSGARRRSAADQWIKEHEPHVTSEPFGIWAYVTRPSYRPSIEDQRDIHALAHGLADRLENFLPCIDATRSGNNRVARASDYWGAQAGAYAIEDLLDPGQHEFGSEERKSCFCKCGSEKVERAASQFLTTFDKIIIHYGWHTDAERIQYQQQCVGKGRFGRFARHYIPGAPQEQEPQPAPINVKLLEALRKSADRLWWEVLQDLPRRLDPQQTGICANAMLPDAKARLCTAFAANPGGTDAELEEATGVTRGSLYRLGLAELRENYTSQAKEEAKKTSRAEASAAGLRVRRSARRTGPKPS
jgi:hypothetical protein